MICGHVVGSVYTGWMEQKLLYPLLDVLAKERKQDRHDLTAANIVAYRMLRSPYLGQTYASYYLAQTAPGDWRLFQDWRGEAKDRDPMIAFYRDCYMEVDDGESLPDVFIAQPQARTIARPVPINGEDGIDGTLRARADALLERVRAAHPEALQRLLEPTQEQTQQRYDLPIVEIDSRQIGAFMREKLGDFYDGSLKSSGIDYHTPDHFTHKSIYLVACNEDEVAGMLKLGTSRAWGYGLSYVSVAPGFRGQGLSKRLYQQALDICERDRRVFIRSQPGEFTQDNPNITASYDHLVRQSAVLHTDSESPFLRLFQTCVESGMDYATMLERFKSHCDAAIPSLADRKAGSLSWQRRQGELDTVARLLNEEPFVQQSRPGRRPAM